jgi:hypothetical protein
MTGTYKYDLYSLLVNDLPNLNQRLSALRLPDILAYYEVEKKLELNKFPSIVVDYATNSNSRFIDQYGSIVETFYLTVSAFIASTQPDAIKYEGVLTSYLKDFNEVAQTITDVNFIYWRPQSSSMQLSKDIRNDNVYVVTFKIECSCELE